MKEAVCKDYRLLSLFQLHIGTSGWLWQFSKVFFQLESMSFFAKWQWGRAVCCLEDAIQSVPCCHLFCYGNCFTSRFKWKNKTTNMRASKCSRFSKHSPYHNQRYSKLCVWAHRLWDEHTQENLERTSIFPSKTVYGHISYMSLQIQTCSGQMLHKQNFMCAQTLTN